MGLKTLVREASLRAALLLYAPGPGAAARWYKLQTRALTVDKELAWEASVP